VTAIQFSRTLAGFLAIFAFCSSTLTQDKVSEDSTVRYPASYFQEWAPITAQDMFDLKLATYFLDEFQSEKFDWYLNRWIRKRGWGDFHLVLPAPFLFGYS
tara:strand:- start:580 stop:882 length:303 start_codon:yes stop_codon:yes gene_type:complete